MSRAAGVCAADVAIAALIALAMLLKALYDLMGLIGDEGLSLLTMFLICVATSIRCVCSSRRVMAADHGCCRHGGYDLRGNISGVCPECGAKRPRVAN